MNASMLSRSIFQQHVKRSRNQTHVSSNTTNGLGYHSNHIFNYPSSVQTQSNFHQSRYSAIHNMQQSHSPKSQYQKINQTVVEPLVKKRRLKSLKKDKLQIINSSTGQSSSRNQSGQTTTQSQIAYFKMPSMSKCIEKNILPKDQVVIRHVIQEALHKQITIPQSVQNVLKTQGYAPQIEVQRKVSTAGHGKRKHYKLRKSKHLQEKRHFQELENTTSTAGYLQKLPSRYISNHVITVNNSIDCGKISGHHFIQQPQSRACEVDTHRIDGGYGSQEKSRIQLQVEPPTYENYAYVNQQIVVSPKDQLKNGIGLNVSQNNLNGRSSELISNQILLQNFKERSRQLPIMSASKTPHITAQYLRSKIESRVQTRNILYTQMRNSCGQSRRQGTNRSFLGYPSDFQNLMLAQQQKENCDKVDQQVSARQSRTNLHEENPVLSQQNEEQIIPTEIQIIEQEKQEPDVNYENLIESKIIVSKTALENPSRDAPSLIDGAYTNKTGLSRLKSETSLTRLRALTSGYEHNLDLKDYLEGVGLNSIDKDCKIKKNQGQLENHHKKVRYSHHSHKRSNSMTNLLQSNPDIIYQLSGVPIRNQQFDFNQMISVQSKEKTNNTVERPFTQGCESFDYDSLDKSKTRMRGSLQIKIQKFMRQKNKEIAQSVKNQINPLNEYEQQQMIKKHFIRKSERYKLEQQQNNLMKNAYLKDLELFRD